MLCAGKEFQRQQPTGVKQKQTVARLPSSSERPVSVRIPASRRGRLYRGARALCIFVCGPYRKPKDAASPK
jgi:hypothetical protein